MRERRNAIFPIALSPAKLADCLGVRPEVVAQMIRDGMPVHRHALKRRVFVQDAVEAIRSGMGGWKIEG
jgi:hypothetical protein